MRKREIEKLVNDALGAEGEKRAELMYELSDLVKEHEGDETGLLAPIERAMPQLADYLLDEKTGNVSGCTISIFRRIPFGCETIARLIQIQETHPNPMVVEAIGKLDPSDWSDEVEETLAKALEQEYTVDQAVYAFFCNAPCINHASTLSALASAVFPTDWCRSSRAVATLASSTQHAHGNYAMNLLNEILDQAPPDLRKDIATCLGWATDRGLPLLTRLATDESPTVREATAQALGRGYLENEESRPLLEKLKCDPSTVVQKAAIEALNSSSS
ncbi:MAG: HEAT repeat domain-containing protein [Planctomycetaceae bacterium]|nr:HEAT repeat domain-containing protein [Planctomycetaceae bacterium]